MSLGGFTLLWVRAVVSIEVDGLRPQLLLRGGAIVEWRLLRPETRGGRVAPLASVAVVD